jgi:uncharacterized repeat protein (TIGR03803 family)
MRKLLVRIAAVLIAATASHSWAQTFETIHTFTAAQADGATPWATLMIGPDRALYGTASEGGLNGVGTAFKLTTAGSFTLLGNFNVSITGKAPKARLIDLADGFLYGASSLGGGAAGDPVGTVFKLDPAGSATPSGAFTKIFDLPGSGITPMVPLSLTSGEAGVLHVLGSSPGGIWRVPANGNTPTVVFNFPVSGDDGQFPQSIRRAADGYLYGVTAGTGAVGTTPGRRGTVFRIQPNGSDFTKLHDCLSETGVNPIGGLAEGPDGMLYGTTSGGGTNLDGVIYRITPGGEYTVLHHSNDNPPTGDLLLASDGRLYGTSSAGGANLYGSVFRINTNGTGFQVIHSFNRTNGSYPKAGLIQADDGNLYGTTSEGGADDLGTIFRIDLNLPVPQPNRGPIAIDDFGFSDGAGTIVAVLANDFDPDEGDNLVVTIETQPLHGTASLEVGGQILYMPTAGQYNGSDEFTYRITDPDGLFAIGTVTISDDALPAPWAPGVYNGLLNLDPNLAADTQTPRGQLVINIAPTGLFTGKLFAQGKRFPVRGLFDDSGTAVAVVKLPRKGAAILFLAPGEGNSLFVVMFSQELWTGALSPLLVPNPVAKTSFTVLVEADSPGLPAGGGYAAMRMLPNGLVVAVGKLGDGSKLIWGSTLVSLNGTAGIPVFNSPVPGGACGGLFAATGASPTFQGQLRWIRPPAAKPTLAYPAGFSGDAIGFMDIYTPPPRGVFPVDFGIDQAGLVGFSGPLAIPDVAASITVNGARLVPVDPIRSFTINRATGLFAGRVKLGTKTFPFKGAVLQSIGRGIGYYTAGKETGFVAFVAD